MNSSQSSTQAQDGDRSVSSLLEDLGYDELIDKLGHLSLAELTALQVEELQALGAASGQAHRILVIGRFWTPTGGANDAIQKFSDDVNDSIVQREDLRAAALRLPPPPPPRSPSLVSNSFSTPPSTPTFVPVHVPPPASPPMRIRRVEAGPEPRARILAGALMQHRIAYHAELQHIALRSWISNVSAAQDCDTDTHRSNGSNGTDSFAEETADYSPLCHPVPLTPSRAPRPPAADAPQDLAGFLWKKGGSGIKSGLFSNRSWRRRFFVLQQGAFMYYHSKEEFLQKPLESFKFKFHLAEIDPRIGLNMGWLQRRKSTKAGQENRELLVLDCGGSWTLTMGAEQAPGEDLLKRWEDALMLHYSFYIQKKMQMSDESPTSTKSRLQGESPSRRHIDESPSTGRAPRTPSPMVRIRVK